MAERILNVALWVKASGVRLSLDSAPAKPLSAQAVNDLHRLGVRAFSVVKDGAEIGELSLSEGGEWQFRRMSWTHSVGPRGGSIWTSDTGKVRHQKDNPGKTSPVPLKSKGKMSKQRQRKVDRYLTRERIKEDKKGDYGFEDSRRAFAKAQIKTHDWIAKQGKTKEELEREKEREKERQAARDAEARDQEEYDYYEKKYYSKHYDMGLPVASVSSWVKATGVRLSMASAPSKPLSPLVVNDLHRLGVRSFGVVLGGKEIGRLSHDGRQWSFVRGRTVAKAMALGGRLYSTGAFVPDAVRMSSHDKIPGGLADDSESEPSKEELEAGIAVEMEHTNDRKLAEEIARDHLVEDKRYYSKLKAAKLSLQQKRLAWERYVGNRGGRGWKETVTGEVAYQEKMPGERGSSSDDTEKSPASADKFDRAGSGRIAGFGSGDIKPDNDPTRNFEGATKDLTGERHANMKSVFKGVAESLGVTGKYASVIGDWAGDGSAEASVAARYDNVKDADELEYLLACQGMESNQRGMLGFIPGGPGDADKFAYLRTKASVAECRKMLSDLGIMSRSIARAPGGGSMVMIVEFGGEYKDAIEQFQSQSKATGSVRQGKAVPAGVYDNRPDSRGRARKEYTKIIRDYHAKHPGRPHYAKFQRLATGNAGLLRRRLGVGEPSATGLPGIVAWAVPMPPTITAGMTKWDANDLADLTEMKRRNSPRRMSGAKPAKRLAQWERYQGRRGGKGWRNTSSGVVVYQDKMPGDNQGGAAEQPKGGKPPSGKAQPDQAGAAAPQPAQAQPAQAAQPAAAPQAQQAAQPAAQQAAQPQDDLQSPEIDAGDVEQVEQAAPTAGEKVTPPPPGEFYHPDPAKGEAARVGVPGDSAPPPPNKIPRLPNLTDDERAVEEAFASAYERDPAAVAGAFLKGVYESNTPKVFETDAAKCLSPVWMQPGKSEDDRKKARSLYNTALHQTANAIAKRAFLQHLDKIAATKPEGQRHILVTAGGCGAGKGYALANVKEVGSLQDATDGIWDSAGDQNSTEMEWLYKHAKQRGIKATFVYVHNDPMSIWGNPKMGVVQRAKAQGRMVDARVFADSHTHGARNFQKFAEKAGKDPNVSIVYLDNSNPSGPSQVPSIPQSAIEMDPESLYVQAMSYLQQADVPEHVKRGGMVSARLWPSGGNPNVKSKPTKPKAAKAVSSPGSFGAGTATPAATATAAA